MTSYACAVDVQDELRARKFPVPFAYGPERFKRGRFSTFIVWERDRKNSDQLGPALGRNQNPPKIATRGVAVLVTVWAKSEKRGAHLGDHEDLAEHIADAVYCAVTDCVTESQGLAPTWRDMRYVTPEEIAAERGEQPEVWHGVVYAMRFLIPRGVYRLSYLGEGLPEGTVNGIAGETRLLRNADDPPEIVPTNA